MRDEAHQLAAGEPAQHAGRGGGLVKRSRCSSGRGCASDAAAAGDDDDGNDVGGNEGNDRGDGRDSSDGDGSGGGTTTAPAALRRSRALTGRSPPARELP